jgi:hypothetical protein
MLRCEILAGLMTARGQNPNLPHCNTDARFTSMSGHAAASSRPRSGARCRRLGAPPGHARSPGAASSASVAVTKRTIELPTGGLVGVVRSEGQFTNAMPSRDRAAWTRPRRNSWRAGRSAARTSERAGSKTRGRGRVGVIEALAPRLRSVVSGGSPPPP